MIRPIILAIVFAVYHASALKCHVVPIGNLSLPDTSPLQECPLGSRSCIKVVDYERGTYTKQCQISNCPMNGRPNSDDNCQNRSSFGAKWSTCCCYEDGYGKKSKIYIQSRFHFQMQLRSLCKTC
uniref:Secreted protein n=1 Tax=Caenorhabditis tropicalis TaxID=1561998 RepID=A0A1I7V3S6_9PELO